MNKIKLLWIFILLLLAFNIFAYLFKLGGDSGLVIIGNILPIICSFVASLYLFFAFAQFRRFDFAKIAWLFLLVMF